MTLRGTDPPDFVHWTIPLPPYGLSFRLIPIFLPIFYLGPFCGIYSDDGVLSCFHIVVDPITVIVDGGNAMSPS